jgi:hypothetical protein
VPAQRQEPDRYEPLPGVFALPGWLWRRIPPAGRLALVVLVLGLIGLAVAIGPEIERSKSERERAEQQERLRARQAREARLRREQRPRLVAGPAAGAELGARRRLLDAAAVSIRDDARRRVAAGSLSGPIRNIECEPFPRNVAGIGAEDSTERRYGRYFCLAVTAEFTRSEVTLGGSIGHPYRLRIDFRSGRYAFCKIAGRPAEGQLKRRLGVTVPRVCGGGP